MPLSSKLAPGFIRLTYSGITLPHHQIIPVNFAGAPTPGVSPTLETSGGDEVDWQTATENYVSTALALLYDDTTRFGLADIYAVDATTGVRNFIYTMNVNQPGASLSGTNIQSVEGVFVFKSNVGKPIKVYCMETVIAADVRNVGIVPADGRQDMVTYILSADNIFYGRTNAYPLAFSTFTSKVNDVLRKRAGFTDV